MTETEYKISGENRSVKQDSENPYLPSDEDLMPGDAVEEDFVVGTADGIDRRWDHHDSEGRVDPERVAKALAQIEGSGLPATLEQPLRTHLLSHQRALRAYDQRKRIRR